MPCSTHFYDNGNSRIPGGGGGGGGGTIYEEEKKPCQFFNTRSSAFTTHLIKKGYKHRLVKDAIEKVRQIPRSRALETSIKKESHEIPFVITFNQALPNIPRP